MRFCSHFFCSHFFVFVYPVGLYVFSCPAFPTCGCSLRRCFLFLPVPLLFVYWGDLLSFALLRPWVGEIELMRENYNNSNGWCIPQTRVHSRVGRLPHPHSGSCLIFCWVLGSALRPCINFLSSNCTSIYQVLSALYVCDVCTSYIFL